MNILLIIMLAMGGSDPSSPFYSLCQAMLDASTSISSPIQKVDRHFTH